MDEYKKLLKRVNETIERTFVNCVAEIITVEKEYEKLDGIVITEKGKGQTVCPVIYIEPYYDAFYNEKIGMLYDRELLTEQIAAKITDKLIYEYIQINEEWIEHIKIENAKENVIPKLINTQNNEEMLKNIPNIEIGEFSVKFAWQVNKDSLSIYFITITNKLLEMMDMDKESLYEQAVENMNRVAPPRSVTMYTEMKEQFEMLDIEPFWLIQPPEKDIYILTNNNKIDGAFAMLCEEVLENLSEQLEADLYIIPASIHEALAVSVKEYDPQELEKIITEVNTSMLEEKEYLSDQIYYYDAKNKTLTVAPHLQKEGQEVENILEPICNMLQNKRIKDNEQKKGGR